MANRSYLYASSHQPTRYDDRPESIKGLSEWAYDVPLVYYILLSGQPRIGASLISDSLEDDEPGAPTPLYALTGDFDTGLRRLRRFADVARRAAVGTPNSLAEDLDAMLRFLEENREQYALLETSELDLMSSAEPAELRRMAEEHRAAAQAAGAAVDALSRFGFLARRQLSQAAESGTGVLAPFKGISLAANFDHNREVQRPLGVSFWTDVLYFGLMNRQVFEEMRRNRTEDGNADEDGGNRA